MDGAPVSDPAPFGFHQMPGRRPALRFMGSSGSAVVPAGAKELFLGTMDGYGWANNIGAFTVEVSGTETRNVPEASSTLGLLSLALGGLLAFAGRLRKPVHA